MSFNINATNIYLRKGPQNVFNRVQQWATFARQWWFFDAKNQDPFQTAYHVRPYLNGKMKPIFLPTTDCGDHVVIVNSKHIALEGDLWERIEFFHHTGYAGGATWTPAWKLHQDDPTEFLRRQIKKKFKNTRLRALYMSRCHIYPEEEVPEEIMRNVTGQIRRITEIPKKLSDYSEEERENFPRVFQFPKDFVLHPNTGYKP